jgi:hypothetical protein
LEIGYCETVKINHISGASEIGADSLDKWLRKRRGIFLFYKKHYHAKDVINIAKSTMIKSNIALKWLHLTQLFKGQLAEKIVDKKHRLQASIIIAKETIDALKK